MHSAVSTLPIDPTTVRRAFGEDRHRPAIPGRIIGVTDTGALVALVTGTWIELAVGAPRYQEALLRDDLCRYNGHELVVLVNPAYGLVGLAVGPPEPPRRLAVRFGEHVVEDHSVIEIPGEAEQPGWLLFRCAVRRLC